jgi:hypothetical protein
MTSTSPGVLDTPIRLTFYPNPYQVEDGEAAELTLRALFEDVPRGPKTEMVYIAAHALREGGRRRTEHIESVGPVLLLDSDGWTDEHEAQLERLPGQWVVHPSPSNKPGRVRIWVSLTRAVSVSEYKVLYSILNSWLLYGLDRQCSFAAQGYYYGLVDPLADFAWREYGTEPIDVDALDLSDLTPPMPAPTRAELSDFDDDWRVKQARLAADALPGAREGGRHRSLFVVAQVCRDWGVSLAATAALVKDWNFARCSPPETDDEIDNKVLVNLDHYRRNPVGCNLAVTAKIHRDHTKTLDRVTRVLLHRCGSLYVRDGELIELYENDRGGMQMRLVETDRLNELVASNVQLLRWDKGAKDRESGWIRADAVPPWVPRELCVRPSHTLRALNGLAPLPCLRPNGSVLAVGGYDYESKLYLERGEDVPQRPPRQLCLNAHDRVAKLYSQFPLTPEQRSVIFSYLLCAVGRHYIDGPVPVLILDANRPQVGKSKLAEMISIVAAGYRVSSRAWSGDSKDMLDTLHAAVATEPRVVLFDNVLNNALLASAVLDGALTHGKIARVKKYTHYQMELTFRPLVVVTGNGLRIGSDLAPRGIFVRLKTELEDPSLRDDLEIPELLQHVQEHLPQISADLLTCWRGWITAGSPTASTPWATFQDWNKVRGVTTWLGLPDPLTARQGAAERDIDTEVLELLLRWIHTRWPGEGVSPTMLAASLARRPFAASNDGGVGEEEEDRAELSGRLRALCGSELDAHSIGTQLTRFCDRVQGGLTLVKKRPGGRTRWIARELFPPKGVVGEA